MNLFVGVGFPATNAALDAPGNAPYDGLSPLDMPDAKDLRYRARVHMELPVRVRQIAPPRNLIDTTRTVDVSRNGILIRTREPYDMHSTVWVTMHYRPDAATTEAEFPAPSCALSALPMAPPRLPCSSTRAAPTR